MVVPPHARAAYVRRYEKRKGILPLAPQTEFKNGTPITSLMVYNQKPVQRAIQALKYNRESASVRMLAQALSDYIAEEMSELSAFSARTIVITAVPLAPKRLQTRGFNQIDELLTACSALSGGPPVVHLLKRVQETKPQTHLSRAERLKNVTGAFAATAPHDMSHVHVIVVDDVTTTGATLIAAGSPLEACGARVTRLAMARAL